ncbi:MAG: hypothetical protein HDT42_09455 [Ruminococcaceae bacterium]|nr:hypothetical protein [Oscillospiraceae bacterium]
MGRPMGGGSSGGGSGGGFRPSRPSGGGGGRPMGGSSMGGGRPSGGGHRPPPPPPSRRTPPPPRYGGGYGAPPPPPGGGYRRSGGGCLSGIISLVMLFVLVGGLFALNSCLNIVSCLSCSSCGKNNTTDYEKPPSSTPASLGQGNQNNNDTQLTVTKNSPANPFNADCVVDETGWFDNPTKLGKDLEFFYMKYGIQPYVVFKTFDSSVTTNSQRQSYCKEWYLKNIKDNDTFLVIYFSEKNDEVGYFAYWGGSNVDKSVNTLEKSFEEGINKYWFNGNLSLDDVMLNSFKYAANKVKVK